MNPFRTQSDRDDYSEPEITTMDIIREWWKDFNFKSTIVLGILTAILGEGCGYTMYTHSLNDFWQVNFLIISLIVGILAFVSFIKKITRIP